MVSRRAINQRIGQRKINVAIAVPRDLIAFEIDAAPNLRERPGQDILAGPIGFKILKAVFAGWLIAMMVWLLPSAKSAKLLVIMLLTYIVGVGHFSHVIAGSAECAFAVLTGHASAADYFLRFLAPTLIGNTLGGVALVALLNHAPLVPELTGEMGNDPPQGQRKGRK